MRVASIDSFMSPHIKNAIAVTRGHAEALNVVTSMVVAPIFATDR